MKTHQKLHFLFFSFIVLLLWGCSKEETSLYDSAGVATKLPHLWKTSISPDNNTLADNAVRESILDKDNNVIVGGSPSKRNDSLLLSQNLIKLNADDGHIMWTWSDFMNLQRNPKVREIYYLNRGGYYIYNNKLFFATYYSFYCIDLGTGNTFWKKHTNYINSGGNTGIGQFFLSACSVYGNKDGEKIYVGSIDPQETEQVLLTPNYTKFDSAQNWPKSISTILPFKYNGDNLLAFVHQNDIPASEPYWTPRLFELNLYNFSQKKWVYQNIAINPDKETQGAKMLLYANDKLYFSSMEYVYCYEAFTGKQLWKTYLGSTSGLETIADGKLFIPCEDRILYCIDINSGRILWEENNTGNCTPLNYLNGVVYYIGGGDGLLHAVDATTGKHIWKISSPDLDLNRGAYFYATCAIVPGKEGKKGKIIATTGLNAYCFEAAR